MRSWRVWFEMIQLLKKSFMACVSVESETIPERLEGSRLYAVFEVCPQRAAA